MYHKENFQYPVNLRLIAVDANSAYLTFDIIGNSSSAFGNWWSVFVTSNSHGHRHKPDGSGIDLEKDIIELAGRVVDHWNGSYSVYFSLPIFEGNETRTFTLDLVLDYLGCIGYPENIHTWRNYYLKGVYHGDLALRLTLSVKSALQTYRPESKNSYEIAKYLCDTGYYSGGTWTPSKSVSLCSPIAIPSVDDNIGMQNKILVLIGDSTTGQVARCFHGCQEPCQSTEQCKRVEYTNERCRSSVSTSRQSENWKALQVNDLNMHRYNPYHIDFFSVGFGKNELSEVLRRLIKDLKGHISRLDATQRELIIVFNVGLHEMVLHPWKIQISNLAKATNQLLETINGFNKTLPIRALWRGIWSVHEYCYQPNNYWFGKNYKSTFRRETTTQINRLRDASVWMHHSFVSDYISQTAINSNISFVNNYWLSKSRMKRTDRELREHDMRHHDTSVIRASIEVMLDAAATKPPS